MVSALGVGILRRYADGVNAEGAEWLRTGCGARLAELYQQWPALRISTARLGELLGVSPRGIVPVDVETLDSSAWSLRDAGVLYSTARNSQQSWRTLCSKHWRVAPISPRRRLWLRRCAYSRSRYRVGRLFSSAMGAPWTRPPNPRRICPRHCPGVGNRRAGAGAHAGDRRRGALPPAYRVTYVRACARPTHRQGRARDTRSAGRCPGEQRLAESALGSLSRQLACTAGGAVIACLALF